MQLKFYLGLYVHASYPLIRRFYAFLFAPAIAPVSAREQILLT